MIDDLNHPVCYPVTSIMNGLAIFKKSKFGQKFIFLTQYESTFILLTWSKKILAKRIFEQNSHCFQDMIAMGILKDTLGYIALDFDKRL